MSRQTVSLILLLLAAALALAGLATVIPWQGKMVSDLGYYTFCPFAPYSTGAMLILAWLAWTVRKHMTKQTA
jgi:hypothetical protein